MSQLSRLNNRALIRGDEYILLSKSSHYVQKYSFTAHAVNIWNGLPDHVVDFDSALHGGLILD